MAYASFTFTSDSFSRTVRYRDAAVGGNEDAKDIVIWLHGGGSAAVDRASIMLDRIRPRTNVLDVAPHGLTWQDNQAQWITTFHVGNPQLPVGAAGNEDMVFFTDLVGELNTRFPNHERKYVVGYSAGAGMVLDLVRTGIVADPYSGFASVKNVLHSTQISGDSMIVNNPAIPLLFWWATADDTAGNGVGEAGRPGVAGAPIDKQTSVSAIQQGFSASRTFSTQNQCCGRPIVRHHYNVPRLLFIEEIGAPHAWGGCSHTKDLTTMNTARRACSIDDYCIEFFKTSALLGAT